MADDIPPDDEGYPEDDDPSADDDFHAVFGQELSRTLDIDTWTDGFDIEGVMRIFRDEIANAVEKEGHLRNIIRQEVLPLLRQRPGQLPEAGVYPVKPDELTAVLDGLLFPGHVAAVNGISTTHDSLPLGITQLGVAIVSYGGTSGTFSQRLFRKDVAEEADPLREARAFIQNRQNRPGPGQRDNLSRLARRGIRTYAERAILLKKSEAEWRMGRGNPCAHELLTGSGNMDLLEASLSVLRQLILGHKKFVFVPSGLQERGFLTIGHALNAGEYILIETLERYGNKILGGFHEGDARRGPVHAFVRECCPVIVTGVFRATDRCPPRLFHAHREHFHLAAAIAMADSLIRPERGFPMLLDVAESTCRSAFGEDGFLGLVHDAYAQAGANLQYFDDLKTRR